MILWAIVAGALIGWGCADGAITGLLVGGLLGAGMGAWLRNLFEDGVARAVERRLAGWEQSVRPVQSVVRPEPPAPTPPATTAATAAMAQSWTDRPPAWEEPARTPAATHQPSEPPEPSMVEVAVQRTIEWFTGGNTIVRVGLVVLFVGLVFLARLVANAGLFPLEARLATVGLVGAALLAIGFIKRIDRPDFALHLQGGGVAVMYLTVFAAARIYEVMPPLAAFAFMILFAALGAFLAVIQDSRIMALASFLGGYAVPILLGGEAETPLGLFSYITILNLAVMGIAWKKSWRLLNLLGFFATFGLASVWGFGAYQDRHFLICEVFLAVSVAIYLSTALLYAHNTPGKLGNVADSTLLFGTALAGFGLQAGLVHDRPYAAAWSALVFGAVYLGVAAWAMKRRQQGMGLLSECVLAIGIGFVTMAIPLALDVKWVGASWALEGAGAFWVGARQARWMPRAFGLLLQALGAALTVMTLQDNISTIPLANNGFVGPLLIALPMVFTAWLLRGVLPHSGSRWAKGWEPIERALGEPWFLGGFAIAVLAVTQEATRALPPVTSEDWARGAVPEYGQTLIALLGTLALMALANWFGRTRDWAVATWPGRISLPLITFAYLATLAMGRRVTDLPDAIAWLAVLGIHFRMLQLRDLAHLPGRSRWDAAMHTGGVLLLTAMTADILFKITDKAGLYDTSWSGVVFLVSATAMLFGLTRWAGPAEQAAAPAMSWPLYPHARAYWWRAGIVLAVLTWLGAAGAAWFAAGDVSPLPYIPFLNPIDLAVGLAIAALTVYRQLLQTAEPKPRLAAWISGNGGLGMLAVLGFIAINGIWVRTAHHFLGVPWDYSTLSDPAVLTGFSILWALIAMALMLLAQRRAMRLPWLVGAVLLGVVVAKLLFVDMSQAEGIARIVAFIGVGVLMLLIGYFVPLPPRKGTEENVR